MCGLNSFCRKLYNKCTSVHARMEQLRFTKFRFRFLDMSPAGLFGIIVLPNCYDFNNCEDSYECCDKMFVRADDRRM